MRIVQTAKACGHNTNVNGNRLLRILSSTRSTSVDHHRHGAKDHEMSLPATETTSIGQEFILWASQLKPAQYPQADAEKLIAFRFWISRLSIKQADRIANEVAKLCALPGFSRGWFRENLSNPKPGTHPDKMMTYFGLAVYERWNIQHHLRLLSWIKAPRWNGNEEFGWLLYLYLVEAGFTELPGEFLLDSPSKRAIIIERTIREAYSQDYDLLIALTREIIYLQNNNLETYSKKRSNLKNASPARV